MGIFDRLPGRSRRNQTALSVATLPVESSGPDMMPVDHLLNSWMARKGWLAPDVKLSLDENEASLSQANFAQVSEHLGLSLLIWFNLSPGRAEVDFALTRIRSGFLRSEQVSREFKKKLPFVEANKGKRRSRQDLLDRGIDITKMEFEVYDLLKKAK